METMPAAKSRGSTQGLCGEKGTLYEGGICVPGILQWPDVIEQNRQTDYPVSTLDFLPTELDITDTELPGRMGKEVRNIFAPHLLLLYFCVDGLSIVG